MFGNKAQMQNMLKKARKMQEDLQKKQEELKQQTVDVSVGGGAVALTLNGDKQVVSLKIAKMRSTRKIRKCSKTSSPPLSTKPARRQMKWYRRA